MDAASAASAPPWVSASYMCRAEPAPPEAITGRRTAALTARVSSMSYPVCVPSLSIDVSRISPAPSPSPNAAHSTASRPVGRRPPWLKTSQPSPSRRLRASIASTTHWAPKTSAQRVIRVGSASAAVLTDTLSAPCVSSSAMSGTLLTPPPTASGMNTWSAVRSTVSSRIFRASDDAVMSRKMISSAPSRSYAAASSAGSPASRSSWKRTPLTTRPSVTSRQGMIRFAGMSVADGKEVGVQAKPVGAALLRVELRAHHVSRGCRGRRRVVGAADPLVRFRRRERVHVVEVGPVGDALPERRRAGLHGATPADHRNAIARGDLDHPAGEQPESFVPAVLARLLEQELIAEADAEHRLATPRQRDDSPAEAVLRQSRDGRRERSDARQDDAGRRLELAGIGGESRLGSDLDQRALDRSDVADPVIDDRDHFKTPFDEGTPGRPVDAVASCSARPRALNVASTMWCRLRPRIRST